jgi:hypothetical protein
MDVKWLQAEEPQKVVGVIISGSLRASLAQELPVSALCVLGSVISSEQQLSCPSVPARQSLIFHQL